MPGPELPLVREVDVQEPAVARRALAGQPHVFVLESALFDDRARWTFFGADPFAVARGAAADRLIAGFRRLVARLRAERAAATAVPFTGGLVGYWAYDWGRRLETLRVPAARAARDDLSLPDRVLGIYDVVGAHDHESRRTWLFSSGLPLDGAARRAHAERRLDRFARTLERARGAEPAFPHGGAPAAATSTFHPDDYRRAVERVREHIRCGDIFQANLSQRWTLPLPEARPIERAAALHEALARLSPAPYAACLDADDHAVACASPERFLELRGRLVVTRPIKGTRPRSADPGEDRRLGEELRASSKDRAENVMIVDVLRNDLGRACETGTVTVPALCELETFAQVHHLTSTVTGVLREDLDALGLLEACFPGGSITGAPKIRAMEILDALEPVRRHLYTGSVGYVDWSGDADWNVAIRTATLLPRAALFAAGGGITADSDPDAEYRETLAKAEGIRRALAACVGPVTLEPGAVHAG